MLTRVTYAHSGSPQEPHFAHGFDKHRDAVPEADYRFWVLETDFYKAFVHIMTSYTVSPPSYWLQMVTAVAKARLRSLEYTVWNAFPLSPSAAA
jgi:hypothetical protein